MSETDLPDTRLEAERLQRLRTKYRVERKFAVEEMGLDEDASRSEIRETLLQASPWERQQLQYRKRRAYRRLDELMEENEPDVTYRQ